MKILGFSFLGFLCGAIPFSFLLGRAFAGVDVRQVGDGNPGATNAWRAGGWPVGVAALLLDYVKGAVPVGLAHLTGGISGWGLVPVALAPVLGHAFSPFLRFRGGKAVAVTFGIWTGLTLGEGPILLGLLLGIFFSVLDADGWSVAFSLIVFLAHLVLHHGDPVLLAVGLGNGLLLAWKHRRALGEPVRPRTWVTRLAEKLA